MKKLDEKYRKNEYEYRLHTRAEKKAIYYQYLGNRLLGYEVFKILVREASFSTLLNRHLPASEKFPSNEDFGKTAWSFSFEDRAMKKYNQL